MGIEQLVFAGFVFFRIGLLEKEQEKVGNDHRDQKEVPDDRGIA